MNESTVPETWLPVVGWEGLYEVSDLGRVRSLDRITSTGYRDGKILSPSRSGSVGYLRVPLCLREIQRRYSVHQLVMHAFVGLTPDGLEIRHLDGDPANNRLVNLAYGTHSENMKDAVTHGTHVQSRKTHCPQDHLYDVGNTRINDGKRSCRKCGAENLRKYRQSRLAQ